MRVGGACRAGRWPEPQGCRGEAKDWAGRLGPQHTSKAVPSSQGVCGESSALATYPGGKRAQVCTEWASPDTLGCISGWTPSAGCRDGSAGGSSQPAAAGCLAAPCSWQSRSSAMLMDLPISPRGSREQRSRILVGLFLWTEGSGPESQLPSLRLVSGPQPILTASPSSAHSSFPSPPLVFGASRM